MPPIRHLLAFVALAAVLAAGGCAAMDEIVNNRVAEPDRPSEQPQAKDETAVPGGDADQPKIEGGAPSRDRAPVPPSVSAARPPTSARPVSPDSVATWELLGQTEFQVVDLLGVPVTVRNEPPAMVWNYAAEACKFDLFFYFDINNQDFRALSYKFDPGMKTPGEEELCLSAIRRQNARTGQ